MDPSSPAGNLEEAVKTAAATSQEFQDALESLGFQAVPAMTNDEMLQFVADQAAYYAEVLA